MNISQFTTEKREDTFYHVSKNMMVHKKYIWVTEDVFDYGQGDALWRTGWAYIVYKAKELKCGILSCFTDEKDEKGEYIQAWRFPEEGYDENVSRDQITSALCALKINGDSEDLNRILKGLRKKISKKFKITLDMKIWMKSLNGSKFYGGLFCFISFFTTFLGQIWNKILYKWANMEIIEPEELHGMEIKDHPPKHLKAEDLHYPMYAFHLFAWQFYTTPDNIFKTLLGKSLLPFVGKTNYVVRILLGGNIKYVDAIKFKPMTGIRWQNIFFKYHYSSTEVIETHNKYKNMYTNKYNVLDRDMLAYLIQINPNSVK